MGKTLFTFALAFLGWLLSTHTIQAQLPITGIDVIVGRDAQRPGWTRIDVDLNKGAGGDFVWIVFRRVVGDLPLRELKILRGRTTSAPLGYTKIPVDLNQGAGGEWLYLCYSRTVGGAPIVALDVVAGRSSSVPAPPRFTKVPTDLNAGCGSDKPCIYLCYRRAEPPPPSTISYKSLSFNKGEMALIEQAMPLVEARLLNVDWINDACNRSAYTWYDGSNVTDALLLRMHVMRAYNALKQEGIPKLVIRSNSGLGSSSGAGTVGTIFIRYVPGGLGLTGSGHYEVRGNFDIQLNPNQIRTMSPDDVAGTIAHEMWHNLGHSHGDSYTDRNFVTVMGDIIANNGAYIPRTSLRLHRPWYRP